MNAHVCGYEVVAYPKKIEYYGFSSVIYESYHFIVF